ncbi:hypothetical protein ABPG75_004744 [Micractinium tetrahymenae]
MSRAVTALLSLTLGISLGRFLRRLLSRKPAEDPVPASGRLIAAWRALESLEPPSQRLFLDPLASALAGPAAIHEALSLAVPWPQNSSSDSDGGEAANGGAAAKEASGGAYRAERRRFCYSNVGTRVWWFDRQLLAALASPAAPRQVVLLGAGMDSRPWRMPLLPGVRWLEVDVPGVVAAKRRRLDQLGAALEASPAGPDAALPAAAAHPLRAASWAALSADLARPGWSAALGAAGLDPRQPTVWVAEGLLMYLDEGQVAALLQEAAAASPPGSAFIAHHCTRELIALVRGGAGAAAYAPFPPELVSTWRSGFPPADEAEAIAAELRSAGGWQLQRVTSRARIAAEICGSGSSAGEVAACCDFEARPDAGRDRWTVFVSATK